MTCPHAKGPVWSDPGDDQLAGGFFAGTKATITGAWARARHRSFAAFQNDMIALFANWHSRAERPEELLDDLEKPHQQAMASKP